MLEEDDFRDICVTLILDFCRDIIDDQTEIDDVTIAHVNRFCQDWIDENFGKDQTVTDIDTRLTQYEPDTNPVQE